jgi:hypothetical protein
MILERETQFKLNSKTQPDFRIEIKLRLYTVRH